MNSLHRVKVLGREVQVRTTASPEQVRDIEAFVNSAVSEVQSSMKSTDPQVIAILALLNLAEACLQHARDYNLLSDVVSERVDDLVRRIDETVKTV